MDLNTSLTPVRFVDSYHTQSPINKSPNLKAWKERLVVLVKELQSNYAKWKLAQDRGTALCYSIEAKRTHCLEKQEEESNNYYSNELMTACEKLSLITSIFEDIKNNTEEIVCQLRALVLLAGPSSDAIFYRTWKLKEFVSFTEDLIKRYDREYLVKQIVMQHLAHCTDRSKLISYTTSWEFPEYVDSYVDLVFLLLAEEVKLK